MRLPDGRRMTYERLAWTGPRERGLALIVRRPTRR
jgi:hypothetical protein